MNKSRVIGGKHTWESIIISVGIVAVFTILVSVYPDNNKATYKDMSPFVSTTVEYADGDSVSLSGTEFGSINKGDKVTMTLTLPVKEEIDPATLVFGVNHAVTKVYYGDTLLSSFGEDIDARGDMVCHRNFFVEIPEEAWGKTITISLKATENKAFNRIANMWLYPSGKAYRFYFDLEFGRMAVSFSILVISITTFLMMILLWWQNIRRLRLLCLSLFGFISATWMILAEGLQQFWDIDSYVLSTFEYVAFVAQTIPLASYVMAEETEKRRRGILEKLVGADVGFVVIICLLSYCNVAHFAVTLTVSVFFSLFNAIVFVWDSLRNMDFSVKSKRVALTGVAVLSLTGIFDEVRFGLYRAIGTATFSQTQKTFHLGVLFFYVLLLVSAIISEREYQELERHNRAKIMASQIQPHFLYNTLASIREIIFEDPRLAADLLSDFTIYLRGAVHAMSDVQTVPFKEELKNIKAFVEIEKMRMPERLQVFYQNDALNFKVPPFSIQPIVENAIKHGVDKRGIEGGSVTIRSFEQEQHWIVEVSDTGVGFDVDSVLEKASEKDSCSVGLKNIMVRLREITDASVTFNSVPGVGTTVVVAIPKEE